MVQASCYQLALDHKLGEYVLPEGWAIIAAGNRDSDRAVTTRMATPLRNRFVHLETEFSAFLRMFRELPKIDAILLNPTQEPVPENAAAQCGPAPQPNA